MKMKTILKKYEEGEMTLEGVLNELTKKGYCPALIHDDFCYWALVFDGIQNIPLEDEPADINTSFFIQEHQWEKTIKQAVLYALKNQI